MNNYKRDAKSNRKGDAKKSNLFDRCQTPAYALDPILPYLPKHWTIWECAAGEGFLVDTLHQYGYHVISTDILTGVDFFNYEPEQWDCIVTNPPYSLKFKWLERCYRLGKPFALLMPVETIGALRAQRLFDKFGFEWLLTDKRINFKMPNKGWNGAGAQFPVAWFTWKLEMGKPVTFSKIIRRPNEQMVLWNT